MVVDGGIDLSKKPMWIEGPHIYKRNGKYYLMAAEGGTSVNHSEVILRADRVDGPYTPAPPEANPILTQRDLPADRPNPVSAAGHADIVELPGGGFAAIFLATRPYDYAKDYYNIGRETFLLPVDWSGEWPVILGKGLPIPLVAQAPLPAAPRRRADDRQLHGARGIRPRRPRPRMDDDARRAATRSIAASWCWRRGATGSATSASPRSSRGASSTTRRRPRPSSTSRPARARWPASPRCRTTTIS